MRFHLITPVWGEPYTRLFAETVLPCLLSPGNLPRLAATSEARYCLYTTPQDAQVLQAAPAYAQLTRLMPVDLHYPESLHAGPAGKYDRLNACHNLAIAQAEAAGAAMVFPPPDEIWSDGTLGRLPELAVAGKQVVLVPGLRVVRETFVPEVASWSRTAAGAAVQPDPREFVRFLLTHMHPYCRAQFWESPTYTDWPSHVYWRVSEHSFVARCFHMHPLLIVARPRGGDLQSTLDGEYATQVGEDLSRYHVPRDTDEMLGCEISSLAQWPVGGTRRASAGAVARWARRHTDSVQRALFAGRTIGFFGEDPAAIPDLERKLVQTARRARQVMAWLHGPLRLLDAADRCRPALRPVRAWLNSLRSRRC